MFSDLLVRKHKVLKALRSHHVVELTFHLAPQAPASENFLDLHDAHFAAFKVVLVVRADSIPSIVTLYSENRRIALEYALESVDVDV